MTRVPRAVRSGETVVRKRADELTPDDYGLIVQHPGNRGWLRNVSAENDGTWVCTTTGVAVYPNDAEFHVWGYGDPRKCFMHGRPDRTKCRKCAADGRAS